MRAASIDDIDELFELRCSTAQNQMTKEELAEMGITHDSLHEMLSSGDYLSPVLEADGRIVGFGMADTKRGYIFALFVRAGYEGRGIGRRILEYLESALRKGGIHELSLHCGGPLSVRAHGFFRHLGWKTDGTSMDDMLRYIRHST